MKTMIEILSNYSNGKSYLQTVKANQEKYQNRFNMTRYEFVSYKDTPDKFTKAVITIRENLFDEKGKPKSSILCFGKREMKNGGVFWPNMSQGVEKDDGNKEYIKGYEPELKGDALQLEEFVNKCAQAKGDPSLYVKPTLTNDVPKGSDVPFIQRQGVAEEQGLPF